MGSVWSGVHRAGRLSRPIAFKFLSGPGAQRRDYQVAFGREVQAAATLDHPRVVSVFDCGRVPASAEWQDHCGLALGTPFLVMEYVPNGTLSERRGTLAWPRLRTALLDVLAGLAHAHARQVIHRDLKPANLLVDDADRVKLADFGLAHALALPADLRATWSGRVERFLSERPSDDGRVLEVAAALGQELDGWEWEAVCRIDGTTPHPDLVGALVDRGLARWEEGTDRWSFGHGMVREALESRARAAGRWGRANDVCAAALTGRDGVHDRERLGLHLVAAGRPEKGLEPLMDAAWRCGGRGDYAQATFVVAERERALALAKIPREDPRWAEGWLAMAYLRRVQGDFEGARARLAWAEATLDAKASPEISARLALERARVAWLDSNVEANVVALTEAIRLFTDRAALASAFVARGITHRAHAVHRRPRRAVARGGPVREPRRRSRTHRRRHARRPERRGRRAAGPHPHRRPPPRGPGAAAVPGPADRAQPLRPRAHRGRGGAAQLAARRHEPRLGRVGRGALLRRGLRRRGVDGGVLAGRRTPDPAWPASRGRRTSPRPWRTAPPSSSSTSSHGSWRCRIRRSSRSGGGATASGRTIASRASSPTRCRGLPSSGCARTRPRSRARRRR